MKLMSKTGVHFVCYLADVHKLIYIGWGSPTPGWPISHMDRRVGCSPVPIPWHPGAAEPMLFMTYTLLLFNHVCKWATDVTDGLRRRIGHLLRGLHCVNARAPHPRLDYRGDLAPIWLRISWVYGDLNWLSISGIAFRVSWECTCCVCAFFASTCLALSVRDGRSLHIVWGGAWLPLGRRLVLIVLLACPAFKMALAGRQYPMVAF